MATDMEMNVYVGKTLVGVAILIILSAVLAGLAVEVASFRAFFVGGAVLSGLVSLLMLVMTATDWIRNELKKIT